MEDSLGLDMEPLAPQPMGDVTMRDVAPGAALGEPTALAEIPEADKLGLPGELESSSDGAPETGALMAGGALVVHDGGAAGALVVKARKMLSTQWTTEMDGQLTEAVAKFGEGHWSKIAELVEGRTGKQCRERWKNQISSEVKKGDWTVEEDALIVVCVSELGTKWSEISKRFVGRTDNAIKNRYNSEVRKRERAEQRTIREAAAAEERAKHPQAENSAPPNPPRKRKGGGGGGGGKRKKNDADLDDDIWFEADEAVTRLESREIDMLLSELNQDVGPLGLDGGGGDDDDDDDDDDDGADGCDEEDQSLHQVLQSLRRARSPHALLKATKQVCSWEDRQKHGRGKAKLRTPSSHPNAPGPLRMPGSHSQLAQLLHDDEHQLLHDDLLLYDEGTCTYDFSQLLSPEARGSCSLGALTVPPRGRSSAPRSAPCQGARSLPGSQLAGNAGARRSLPSSSSGRPNRPRSAGPTCLARSLPTCGRSAPGSRCPTPQGRSLRGSKGGLPTPGDKDGAGVWGASGSDSPQLTSPTLLADLLASPPLSGSRSGSRRASPRLAAVPLAVPTEDLLAAAAAAADAADAAGIGSSGGSSRTDARQRAAQSRRESRRRQQGKSQCGGT